MVPVLWELISWQGIAVGWWVDQLDSKDVCDKEPGGHKTLRLEKQEVVSPRGEARLGLTLRRSPQNWGASGAEQSGRAAAPGFQFFFLLCVPGGPLLSWRTWGAWEGGHHGFNMDCTKGRARGHLGSLF